MRRGAKRLVGGLFRLLDRRDRAYLLLILCPLFLYTTSLRVASFGLGDGGPSGLLLSDLPFGLGFALFWVGVFGALRSGVLRVAAFGLLHAATLLVVVVATCAYQYLHTTGATLDYSIVAYYLSAPEEATGAVSSESSVWLWVLLFCGLLYSLLGPVLLTRFFLGAGADASEEVASGTGARTMTRERFIAAGFGAGAGALFLRGSLGGEAPISRGAMSNLVATGIEQSRYRAVAADFNGAVDLSKLRLVATDRTRKKHVALIHLESVRHSSVTPYNPDLATMPYLAELSRRSFVVERAYTTVPHTSKAVSSVCSGLFPNPGTEIVEAMPGGMPARCLPELLSEHGYRSAWFQSATKTFENRAQHVKNLGYDHFAAYEDMPTEGFQPCNYLGYEDDIMLGPSREWLEENASGPTFVMYLGLTPHHQYLPLERYGRKAFADGVYGRYLNNIYYDDFWVGNIIEQYRRLGIYEDTVFVIYGDHGEAFGEHGLSGHDGIPYEEGLRVPLVIHEPGNFDGGERIKGPVSHLDLPPTLAGLLGFEVTGGRYPGVDFIGGEVDAGRVLRFSCRPDLLSLIRLEADEKYIHHFGKKPEEYYNLTKDPAEKINLAGRVGEARLSALRGEMVSWHAGAAAAYLPGAATENA